MTVVIVTFKCWLVLDSHLRTDRESELTKIFFLSFCSCLTRLKLVKKNELKRKNEMYVYI